jgi:hypothetical protein
LHALNDTAYSLAGLTEVKTYALKVKAVGDENDLTDSDWSEIVEYTVVASVPTTFSVPENLSIFDVNLTWNEVFGASGYIVAIDGKEMQITKNTCYSLSYLRYAKTYSVKVRAVGNGERYFNSDWSDSLDYTPIPIRLILLTPENVQNDGTDLTLNVVRNASGYIVSVDGTETAVITTRPYSLSDLTEAKTYAVKVKTKGRAGYADSDWSEIAEYIIYPSTEGLLYTLINNDTEYSVAVVTATDENIIIAPRL